MEPRGQPDDQIGLRAPTDTDDLHALAAQRVMGMGDRDESRRCLGLLGSVLWVSPSCVTELTKRSPNWPWNHSGKRALSRTATASGQDAPVTMPSRPSLPVSPPRTSSSLTRTLKAASITSTIRPCLTSWNA